MPAPLLAVLQPEGARVVDPAVPVVRAFDLGFTRGDGAFETLLVRAGTPQRVEPHLRRMARSAAALDLEPPSHELWAALIDALVGAWPPGDEGMMKLMLSRGVEGEDGSPTALGTLAAQSASNLRERAEGVEAVTLSLGLAAEARAGAGWLLGGVKCLSYAVNMAARREAARRGAHDAVFVTPAGDLLEGPTSTLVWAVGGALRTPPPRELGILAGTTQEALFARAGEAGLSAAYARGTVEDLRAADAVWLVSSVRGAAAVRVLDGRPLATDPELTATVQHLIGIPAG